MALVKIGDKPVETRPLTIGMLKRLSKWVKQRPVREAIEQTREFPKDVQSEILRDAYREQSQDKRSIEQVFEEVQKEQDLDSIMYLLWLMVEHAGVTLAEVEALGQAEMEAMFAAIEDSTPKSDTVSTQGGPEGNAQAG